MDHSHEASPAIDLLVDALMQSYGQLAMILDHMMRSEDPDGPPIPEVLANLLRDILEELNDAHGEEDVATAAQMLRNATELVGDNVLLAPLPDLSDPRRGSH
jgi:hypothetical protein